MKNSGCCPKCSSKDIARFPGWEGGHGSGSYLRLTQSWFWPTIALISHYVCLECGYVEEWVDSDLELKKARRAKESQRLKKQR